MLRVAYFGLPLGAHVLARAGIAPVVVAVRALDAGGMRRVRTRLARDGRTLVLGKPDLDRPEVQALVASARPDVLLSWFYPRRIPPALLACAPRGAFGVHPSLLPRWRGPDPYFWALRAGDAQTGVTLHRLDADYDTGDVLAQEVVPIRPEDDAWSLARRLDRPSLRLLVAHAQALARGEDPRGTPQDATAATPAPQPTEEDLAIDFRAATDDVLRLVRAGAPHPGATCLLGDTWVSVLRARRADDTPRALLPGEAALVSGRLCVRTPDAGLSLDLVRLEDDGTHLSGPAVAALVIPPGTRSPSPTD